MLALATIFKENSTECVEYCDKVFDKNLISAALVGQTKLNTPETSIETHVSLFYRESSLYRALWVSMSIFLPCENADNSLALHFIGKVWKSGLQNGVLKSPYRACIKWILHFFSKRYARMDAQTMNKPYSA